MARLRVTTPSRPPALFPATLILLLAPLPGLAQINVSVGNRLETSWEEPTEITRVDDWFNTFFSGSAWEVAARLRVAQAIGSDAPDSVSLDQRSFSLRGGGLKVTAGTFYQQIGRGLIFRAYEQRFVSVGRTSRAFNVDRDVDGVRLGASTPWLELVAFSGKPTIAPPNGDLSGGGPLVGQKIDVVQMISGDVYVFDNVLQLGGAVLGAERTSVQGINDEPPTQTLRNARGRVQTSWGAFYTEWADKRWHGRDPLPAYGRGLYSELTLNGGMWGGSLEYKNYHKFSFVYQDLPTLVRTQQSVLLNRLTHIQKPLDEEGFQLEVVRAPSPWVSTTLNLSGAWSEEFAGPVDFRYREVYLEHQNQGNVLNWLMFADWAEDERTIGRTLLGDKNRWTGGVNFEYLFPPESVYSVLTDLELQTIETVDEEKFTNGFAQIGASKAGRGTLAFLYQWTTRKNEFGDRTEWLAGTFDLQFARAHSLFIFAGARPAGLLCSGGFCTFTPEFEGVEFRLLSAF